MAIDRVMLEILRNHYQAVVEDMARIMERTAYATFVKETADFSTGLVSTGGEYVAYPWNLGASSYLGLNMAHTLAYFDDYDEGDIIICNDAYLSGPLCTHLPDVHILRPVFHEGRIICWGYAFVHSSDIGGAVPASVWPRASTPSSTTRSSGRARRSGGFPTGPIGSPSTWKTISARRCPYGSRSPSPSRVMRSISISPARTPR